MIQKMLPARRFAVVSPNFYPQVCGVGDHSALLADELASRGFEVRVFSRGPAEPHPLAPQLRVDTATGRRPLAIAREIVRQIDDYAPSDLIIQYTPQMWAGGRFGSPALVWLAARFKKRGVRVTLVAHELYVPWLLRPDLAVAAALQRLQFGALIKVSDRVFVTTESRRALISAASALLRAPPPEVLPIGPSAVPVEPICSIFERSPAAPRIGFFSTAAVGKRFDVVLGAFERILREFPSAELVLIGDFGDPALPRVAEIHAAIAEHAARARIRQTGRISLTEIARELATLDLYLFPMSTGANTRSSTLPAAFAAGVPVVATRGAETDFSLFRHRENLVFADEMTSTAFASAALSLLRDRQLAARVAEGGRRLYLENLTRARTTDRLLAERTP